MRDTLYQDRLVNKARLAIAFKALQDTAQDAFGSRWDVGAPVLRCRENRNGFNVERVELPVSGRPYQTRIDKIPMDIALPLTGGHERLAELRLIYGEPC